MQTSERPVSAPPAEPATPRERRRRWPWAMVTVTLALLLAAWIGWTTNVEPMHVGNYGFGMASMSFEGPRPDVRDTTTGDRTVVKVSARPGLRFTYLVSVMNAGPVPVRIVDAGAPRDGGVFGLRPVAMKPDADEGHRADSPRVPFEAFTLPAHTQATLEIEVDVARNSPCLEPGSSIGWSDLPLTFEVLGVTRHTSVPLRTEIRLTGTTATDC